MQRCEKLKHSPLGILVMPSPWLASAVLQTEVMKGRHEQPMSCILLTASRFKPSQQST